MAQGRFENRPYNENRFLVGAGFTVKTSNPPKSPFNKGGLLKPPFEKGG